MKYVAVFFFVIWVWEGASEQVRPLLFWAAWITSVVYGAYLSIKISYLQRNSIR